MERAPGWYRPLGGLYGYLVVDEERWREFASFSCSDVRWIGFFVFFKCFLSIPAVKDGRQALPISALPHTFSKELTCFKDLSSHFFEFCTRLSAGYHREGGSI